MFTCKCARCSDPSELGSFLSAIKCQSDQCEFGFLLPSDSLDPDSEWICTKSEQHQKVPADNIREGSKKLACDVLFLKVISLKLFSLDYDL
jgi:hypothetical protein